MSQDGLVPTSRELSQDSWCSTHGHENQEKLNASDSQGVEYCICPDMGQNESARQGWPSSTEEYLKIQRPFAEKQDQDFQYKCQGCSSLRSRSNMEDHSQDNKEDTDFCQQLPKNHWYLVARNNQWWTVMATHLSDAGWTGDPTGIGHLIDWLYWDCIVLYYISTNLNVEPTFLFDF